MTDDGIIERLDRIEKLLTELVGMVRQRWGYEDQDQEFERRRQEMRKIAGLELDEPAPDVADVYDPNARFYESENAEIEGEGVPQKGKVSKPKTRKRKPG